MDIYDCIIRELQYRPRKCEKCYVRIEEDEPTKVIIILNDIILCEACAKQMYDELTEILSEG